MSNVPSDLKYTKSHEWIQLLDDHTVRVGITDYAQSELGDMVFVELPDSGARYQAGAECAVVESVKSASDLYCPVSGEITEVNINLENNPETVNADPYGEGWIFAIKPDDIGELDELMDADAYAALIESAD